MEIGNYLTGAFGQSKELYRKRNDVKRNRAPIESVQKQIIKDTKEIINIQKEANLSFITDPSFNNFYLFQPLSEKIKEINIGPQENWFNNNVFYWRPQINGSLKTSNNCFTKDYIHFDLLPKESMAIIPSPFTLIELSDIKGYKNKEDAIRDISKILAEESKSLAKKGIKRIQYDEPAIAYKQSLNSLNKEDLRLLDIAMNICGDIPKTSTILHTYFGNAGPIMDYLNNLPVDGIGIDVTETNVEDITKTKFNDKELALGLIDARSPSMEDKNDLTKIVREVYNKSKPKSLWITPNTGTEYIGWTLGKEKIKLLEEVKLFFKENE